MLSNRVLPDGELTLGHQLQILRTPTRQRQCPGQRIRLVGVLAGSQRRTSSSSSVKAVQVLFVPDRSSPGRIGHRGNR